ncbi:MAG: phosphoadenylyl-sulfate reductase [Comamonadaceae bacterium CG_4_9_14_3_um_filter_60_33]|nr:MAG: phosphoadenosine phosphosulfate reductase [Comamonadaceae bacterium CG2_30_59_20]PIY28792.1 MAG: phosphoadenylyl-sulfate reductase [Comamonadaceae bacterium CG_4_10_14_3_um_filter_60_42]PJB46944.1 MAG: phosphoadenylyl-sulfate reductase [Comamonadaceae bacterium CG_4_9_14_3_um_filter_60_33]
MSAIDLNARASNTYAEKLAETRELLQHAAQDYAPLHTGDAPRITLACSLGAEDMVLAHLINHLQLNIGIFVLETGQLHAETLALLDRLQATSRAPVQVFAPVREAAIGFVEREGQDAMYKSIALRKACCAIRKMEPLSRALAGKDAWITGLRREQSGARAEVPLIDRSDAAKVKFNPLSQWTWGDVWFYIAENQVDYNPLHDQFYPSIGCAPCTRAVSAGEDFRAGRWWWEDESAKECGLHVKASPILQTETKK